ncbi:MAG: hypothetical protein IPG57_08320 [Burkholderiales bacterium]|nr:hypothetical protein [Burkholderiales bacterium]
MLTSQRQAPAHRPSSTRWIALAWVALQGLSLQGPAQAQSPSADTPAPAPTAASTAAPTAAAGTAAAFTADLRLLHQLRRANRLGPLAEANTLRPGLAGSPADADQLELDLRHHRREWSADLWLQADHPQGSATQLRGRVKQLHRSGEFGSTAWSLGKKVVSWDVGHAFRPNDLVQQEQRRSLVEAPLEGRGVVQLERFGAEDALSVVWANPEHLQRRSDDQRLAAESALDLHAYRHAGDLDLHGFARLGHHTGASLGTAVAWVAGDELELHASGRWLQRHDGWTIADNGALLASQNPWALAMQGSTRQWLVGMQWTGVQRWSLLAEAWHDGTAPSRADWRTWADRNQALTTFASQPGLPAAALTGAAGNLAWQTTPLGGANLHQDNLFLRLAWQPEGWLLALDTLWHPADHGQMWTARAQWQGDRWRLEAAWRSVAGPGDAVLRQLPTRHSATLLAVRSF